MQVQIMAIQSIEYNYAPAPYFVVLESGRIATSRLGAHDNSIIKYLWIIYLYIYIWEYVS